ncbi:MAG: hypothetical protein AAF747_07265 [Planctomycetota bacterium]
MVPGPSEVVRRRLTAVMVLRLTLAALYFIILVISVGTLVGIAIEAIAIATDANRTFRWFPWEVVIFGVSFPTISAIVFGVPWWLSPWIARKLIKVPGKVPCPSCGYQLQDLVEPRCPECGLQLPPEFMGAPPRRKGQPAGLAAVASARSLVAVGVRIFAFLLAFAALGIGIQWFIVLADVVFGTFNFFDGIDLIGWTIAMLGGVGIVGVLFMRAHWFAKLIVPANNPLRARTAAAVPTDASSQ